MSLLEYGDLNILYENDKYETLNNLKYVSDTIIQRLYSTFDCIAQEADLVEEKAYEKSAQYFDPETMDETYGMEEAFHEGVNHFLIHDAMKNEFLNSSVTWIFHLFEKDCNRIFATDNGDKKKKILENLGIDISSSSLWIKCNLELRLVANTIKHGKGTSSVKLQAIRPDLFKANMFGTSDHEIQLTINDIKKYLSELTLFWESFFNLALPSNR